MGSIANQRRKTVSLWAILPPRQAIGQMTGDLLQAIARWNFAGELS
ncbi:MAG: hypothetical protein ABSC93_22165 [Bryobacteraceae bacterium]|jgi:hypothetical protein